MKVAMMRANAGSSATRVDMPWAGRGTKAQKMSPGHGYYGEHRLDDSRREYHPIEKADGVVVYDQEGGSVGNMPQVGKHWKLTKEQGRAAAAALEKIVVTNASLTYSENTDALSEVGKGLLGAVKSRLGGWREGFEKHGLMGNKTHGKERYRSALEKASYFSSAREWSRE